MAKRSCRTTTHQYRMLMTFMEDHPRLGHGLLTGVLGRETKVRLLDRLVTDLNSDPLGPAKTSTQWLTVWNDWKSNTRKKAAGILEHCSATGGGEKCNKELSPVEERLIQFMGPTAVTGDKDLPEGGFPTPMRPPPPSANYSQINSPAQPAERIAMPPAAVPWTPANYSQINSPAQPAERIAMPPAAVPWTPANYSQINSPAQPAERIAMPPAAVPWTPANYSQINSPAQPAERIAMPPAAVPWTPANYSQINSPAQPAERIAMPPAAVPWTPANYSQINSPAQPAERIAMTPAAVPWTPANYPQTNSPAQPAESIAMTPAAVNKNPLNGNLQAATLKRSRGKDVEDSPAKKVSPSAEEHRAEAVKRLEIMAETSAMGLKLTAEVTEVLKSMAQSMSRMAESLEAMEKTTKDISKNVEVIAAKIMEKM